MFAVGVLIVLIFTFLYSLFHLGEDGMFICLILSGLALFGIFKPSSNRSDNPQTPKGGIGSGSGGSSDPMGFIVMGNLTGGWDDD